MTSPLLIDFKSTFFGRGFVAEVKARGQLLATRESEGWWLYGVHPGAIAADGESLQEAHDHLRFALREVMFQFAQDAVTFDAFRSAVEEFFHDTDPVTAREWDDAVLRVRAEKLKLETLPTKSAALPVEISVTLTTDLRALTPANNVTDADLAQAA